MSTTQELAHWLERDGANCQRHIDCANEMKRLEVRVNELLLIAQAIADQGCVDDDSCGECLPCRAEAAASKGVTA